MPATCFASSRVGASTRIRGGRPRPRGSSAASFAIRGREKARVLPVPVRERPSMSLPSLRSSYERAWIGVKWVIPLSLSVATTRSVSPKLSIGGRSGSSSSTSAASSSSSSNSSERRPSTTPSSSSSAGVVSAVDSSANMFSSCSIAGGAARFSSPPLAARRHGAHSLDDATRGVNAEAAVRVLEAEERVNHNSGVLLAIAARGPRRQS